MNIFWTILVIPLLWSCSQAASPGPTGQALAAKSGGANAVTNAGLNTGVLINVTIASGNTIKSKFPTLAKLQLSITGPVGMPGLPIQLNIPTDNSPQMLKLPSNVNMTVTFDAFDAAGTYIGTGTSSTIVQPNVSPIIPVNIAPVALGTAYIDPLTATTTAGGGGGGGTATAGSISLTTSVATAASLTPVSSTTVIIGSGLTTGVTDANGLANFSNLTLPQDIHVFSGKKAVSVINYPGNSLQIPIEESIPPIATVNVNPPTGPLLVGVNPPLLLDLYFTDGINIQAIPGANGDASVTRFSNILPLRGPVGLTAMIENTAENTPKTDHGLLVTSVASGHSTATPLTVNILDPVLEPRMTPVGQYITIPAVPSGFNNIASVTADIFAGLPANIYALVSQGDKQVLPANQHHTSVWPLPAAQTFTRRLTIKDSYTAASIAWQTEAAPLTNASFPVLPTFYGIPVITQASQSSIRWTDWVSSPIWSGYIVEFRQGLDRSWKIYNFNPGQQLALPIAFKNLSPLIAGVTATATVHRFLIDPASGFNPAQPDLYRLDLYLSHKVSSQAFSFIP